METLSVRANGAAFHVARTGTGKPLVLLHGWPEFWLTWEPVMARLADRFTLFAPDLRGFGNSDKPDGPFGPDQHAADMLAIMDALGITQAGIVGHDVGGAVMQPLARTAPERPFLVQRRHGRRREHHHEPDEVQDDDHREQEHESRRGVLATARCAGARFRNRLSVAGTVRCRRHRDAPIKVRTS